MTFSYSPDRVKDLALRPPIVSALIEAGSRARTLPVWSAASLRLRDAMNPIDALTLLLLSILENDLLGQGCFCGNFDLA